ncbi:MAG: xerD 3 [Phycisphaerales bacterium]|nr:xerD 3 [Phycisphaerales bacterium]
MQPSTSKPSSSRLPAKPTPPEVRPLLVYLQTERGLAKNSIDAYRRDLSDLGDHLAKQAKTLETATADDFRLYLQDQSRGSVANDKKSTKTVARRLAAIRVYLKFCETIGEDRKAVLEQLERPKPEHDLPHILSEAVVLQLINAPDPEHRLFVRDVAILELLYAAGLRASELCTLTMRDTNLTVGAVRVFGKGAKERIVPIGRAAVDAIARYVQELRPLLLKGHSDLLFLSRAGKPMERVALWQFVKKMALRAGIDQYVTTHVLRHCFATHLISGGADLRVVQELLGHADVTTTQIYTHVDGKRLRQVHKQFHPRG